MAFPVTLNGRVYTLADFQGLNYVDGFPDALEDFVTQASDIYNDTSSTSETIGTGSKTFTVSSGKPYQEGTPLRIADAASPDENFLDCVVTSYSGTALTVNAFGFAGSGTFSSWTINIGGAKTVDGTLAVNQGGTGSTSASGARTNLDVYSKAEVDADLDSLTSSEVSYDNTTSGLAATDVQAAVDEVAEKEPQIANTSQAQEGTSNDTFITPLRMREGFNATGSAPVYACRAWVNFDGAGTVSIRASGNVSSITDNGTGDYTVNFSTAMEDADYAVCLGHTSFTASTVNFDVGVRSATNEGPPTLQTTTQVRLLSQMSNGNDKDSGGVYLSIFR